MKCRFVKTVGLLALVGAVGGLVFARYGGARGKVFQQNVESRIDDLLGRTEVQRQQVADKVAEAGRAVETLQDARIRAQVRVDRLNRDHVAFQKEQLEPSSAALTRRLADLEKVKADPTFEVSVGGKTYRQKDLDGLQAVVKDQTERHLIRKREADLKKRILDEAERSLALLQKDEARATDEVAKLNARKRALDAKLDAVRAQQDAARSLKAGKATVAANFDEIDRFLSSLEDETEAALRKAEEDNAVQSAKRREATRPAATEESVDDTIGNARKALEK